MDINEESREKNLLTRVFIEPLPAGHVFGEKIMVIWNFWSW